MVRRAGRDDGRTEAGRQPRRPHHDEGRVTEFPIPSQTGSPINIAVGPDRNVWFTKGGIVGRVTPDGAITEFPLPTPNGGATGLTAGSDRQPPARLSNRLWVAESAGNKIAFLSFKYDDHVARVLLSCAVIAAWPASSLAQTGFADLIDHIHLAAPDQPKAVEWYHAHFGAEPTPEGPDRAMLGTTRLIFQKSEMPKPSAGSILGAVGFWSRSRRSHQEAAADGVKMVMPPVMQGTERSVVDPWAR